MNMTKPRSKKALYIGLPLALAISAGAGFAAWDYWFKDNPGYPVKVMKQADELHERILSFDSHVTVPLDFGTAGNEADKDGTGQFDLVKTGRGRLSGAALTIFGWPEIWNGANAPHRPTAGFVDEARFEQETRYKIISTWFATSPIRSPSPTPPTTSDACMAKASSRSS
jgi:Membrane dipeptidase (Peptidase family M19).